MKKLFCYFLLLVVTIKLTAQAPIITSNTGMPVGNASATGIAYGNSVYVTVLNAGKVYTSADGNNWRKVTDASVPPGTFTKIAFGAGVFVLVGSNGLIASSANGVNWTTRTSGTTNYLTDVQFIQSKFYATGTNTTLRSSANGITWGAVTMGSGTATDQFTSITYGNGVYMLGARNYNSGFIYIYYSSTAASGSWTWKNVDVASASTINKVQFLKDKFYVFTSGSFIYTSTNGSSWTNSTSAMIATLPNSTTQSIGSPNQIFNAIYDGTKFYMFGSSQYHGGYGSIFTSTNGTSFTLEPKTAYIVCQGSELLNGKYFEYGNEGVVSGTDGINYNYPGGSYYAMASNGSSYVGVGTIGSGGVIFSSPDFTSFAEKTPAAQKELSAVVYTGSKYVAAGNKTVIESLDGNTWTQIATPSDYFSALSYGTGRFVAGAYDPATYAGNLAYSADGISWTKGNTADNLYFKVKYVNGKFFALGNSNTTYQGIIMYSADGISWTNITPNLSYATVYFNDVVYDGTKYHFMGMDYADLATYAYGNFFSLSTATVTDPNSFINKGTISNRPGINLGGTYGEGAFAYNNGHFVGAVTDINTQETNIVYSSDGISWTAVPMNETSSVYGIVTEGTGTFRMLGSGDGKFTVFFTSPLAADMLSFTATAVNEQSVLKWQASNASNTGSYTVQRSTDEKNWVDLKSVAGANDNAAHAYEYSDATPAAGINYYRLQQGDATGIHHYSKVARVSFAAKELLVYPNPAFTGTINIVLPQAGNVSIYNSTGAQVLSKALPAGKQQLNVSRLAKGVYMVKTTGGLTKVILQ